MANFFFSLCETPVVMDESAPSWEHCCDLPGLEPSATLTIAVEDQDILGRDHLGTATLDVSAAGTRDLPLEGGGGASLRVSVAPLPPASALEPAPPARPAVREGAGYSLIHSAPLLLGAAVAAAAALTLPFFCVAACAKGERKRDLI